MTDRLHKPVLIVIAGPNGSGKTTITSKILHHEWLEDAVYINPDIIAQEKFGDWNDKDAIMKSVKYCEDLREDCLTKKKCYIPLGNKYTGRKALYKFFNALCKDNDLL